jgi:hypothetical protein
MRGNMREMMSLASAGKEIALTRRARYRWDSAKAVDWSMRAIDRKRRARHIPQQSDPARLARYPRDARPYRQQS